jgi:hypothetical protein
MRVRNTLYVLLLGLGSTTSRFLREQKNTVVSTGQRKPKRNDAFINDEEEI